MLDNVLQSMNNWFVVPNGRHFGTFTIAGGSITLPFLRAGQYFRIVGSVMNDGLHQCPANNLVDETFEGAVWALAVPVGVISLTEEIDAWVQKNPVSAFTSESFAGYTYSKATNAAGQTAGWQDVFRSRLNQWRKN